MLYQLRLPGQKQNLKKLKEIKFFLSLYNVTNYIGTKIKLPFSHKVGCETVNL
jgi:hypothetical protein